MASRAKWIEREIDGRLRTARVLGSPNRMTGKEIHQWAVEYLQSHDEELADYPEQANLSHWDLLMVDSQLQDALFAVLVFKPNELEFFCGTGYALDVRHYCGHDFPDDPADLFRSMRERFRISEKSLRLERPAAELWLGRKW
jgi:hypothetical protein